MEVERSYDSLLRRNTLSASRGATELVNTTYTFDGASRLATVTSGSNSASYNYIAGSSLIGEIIFKHGGSTAMTTAKTYDGLNRLTSISSAPAVGGTSSYAYQYNSAGQRDLVTLHSGDTWNYGYNSRGEVTSGGKKQGGSTNLLGYQFGYAYDNIGNRTSSTKSGRSTTYQANNLNQYTGRTVPGYLDVIGEAKTTATVTVNGTSATRQGKAYYKELSADNSEGPVYLTATVKGELDDDEAERTGKLYLAPNEETYIYDKDGNLKSDGRWTYQWNGENRLVGMETRASAVAAGVPKKRLTYTYDYQGRRISKKVEDWRSSRYQERYTMLFVYDGWNLIAEILQTGPKIRSYVWGSDLSGGNAAGGVGGLLLIGQYPENKHYSTGYDGNGNVTGLFEVESNGEQKGRYEYGPFGEMLLQTTGYATINPIRWSTKYMDGETALAYYGLRYYKLSMGKWINRDPIEEQGGVNLYGFVGNNPIESIDYLGMRAISLPDEDKFNVLVGKRELQTLFEVAYRSTCCKDMRFFQIARDNVSIEWGLDSLKNGASPKVGQSPYPYYTYQNAGDKFVYMQDIPGKSWPTAAKLTRQTTLWGEFEACVACVDNKVDGKYKILGCVKYGHSFKKGVRDWTYGEGSGLSPEPPSWEFLRIYNTLKY